MGFVKNVKINLRNVPGYGEDEKVPVELSCVFDNDLLEYVKGASNDGLNFDSWNFVKVIFDRVAIESENNFYEFVENGFTKLLGPTDSGGNNIWKDLAFLYNENCDEIKRTDGKDYDFKMSEIINRYFKNAQPFKFPLDYEADSEDILDQYEVKELNIYTGDYQFIAPKSEGWVNSMYRGQVLVQNNYNGLLYTDINQDNPYTTIFPLPSKCQHIIPACDTLYSGLWGDGYDRGGKYSSYPMCFFADNVKSFDCTYSPVNCSIYYRDNIFPSPVNTGKISQNFLDSYFCLVFNVFPEECWVETENRKGIDYGFLREHPELHPVSLLLRASYRDIALTTAEYECCLYVSKCPESFYEKHASTRKSLTFYNEFFGYNGTYFNKVNIGETKDNWKDPDIVVEPISPNPNIPDSEPGGGDGLNKDTHDEISEEEIKKVPSKGIVESGFNKLYNPNREQLEDLATFCWSGDLADQLQKLVSDPFDVIVGLNLIPMKPTTGVNQSVKLGNVDTGIIMPIISKSYGVYDLGYVSIRSKDLTNTYLDYSPYTKATLYLPFIGYVDLNIDEIINKNLHIVYKIEYATGSCLASVYTKDDENKDSGVITYTFTGNCASQIPLTGVDYSNTLRNAISGVMGVGVGLAMGAATGNPAMAAIGAAGGLASAATNVATSKQEYKHGGSLSGAVSLLSTGKPFLILKRVKWVQPDSSDGQEKYVGVPLHKTSSVHSLTGYNKFKDIRINIDQATQEEKEEIYNILTTGFIKVSE